MSITKNICLLKEKISTTVDLVVVSKTQPVSAIKEAYDAGCRLFGENKVQELIAKQPLLPDDIHWHFIGHLQTNKVKYISPFVSLIHSIDSLKLLVEVDKEAHKNLRVIDCLLEFFIADEETKYGLVEEEAVSILSSAEFKALKNIRICGVMGMASYVDNATQITNEFRSLCNIFQRLKQQFFIGNNEFSILSMGMSHDYLLAIAEGSNMIRMGTAIFGERNYL